MNSQRSAHVRTLCVVLLFAIGSAAAGYSQTTAQLISEGRTFLAQRDIANANTKFAAAVAADPAHEEANFLYAATRLLVLPTQSPTKEFLDRLGVDAAGRDIYNWKAQPAQNPGGSLIVPAQVSGMEFSDHWRNVFVPEIKAAGVNLSKVVNTSFLLTLSDQETTTADVTIDYGDVQTLRAILHFFEYWFYTTHSWNWDILLTDLETLYDLDQTISGSGNFSAERILRDHPQLFTFATTADLMDAREAFSDAVDRYVDASSLIRGRPSQSQRLFMFDTSQTDAEADFRLTLNELKDSLSAPTTLSLDPLRTVSLDQHFSGGTSPRSMLPTFQDNAFVVGTLPDPTFGGIVTGLTSVEIEKALGDVTLTAPRIRSLTPLGNNEFEMRVDSLADRPSGLESSTDLIGWFPANFQELRFQGAPNLASKIRLSLDAGNEGTFYRFVQSPDFVTVTGNVFDRDGKAVQGAFVETSLDAGQGFTDSNGFFFLQTTKRPHLPNTIYTLTIRKPGEFTYSKGPMLGGAARVDPIFLPFTVAGSVGPAPANDNFADRLPLVGLPTSATGSSGDASREVGEPDHTDLSSGRGFRSVWWTWTSPVNGPVTISTTINNFDTLLGVYTGSSVSSLVEIAQNDEDPDAFSSSRVTFSAVAGTTYQIAVDGWFSQNGDFTLNIAAVE